MDLKPQQVLGVIIVGAVLLFNWADFSKIPNPIGPSLPPLNQQEQSILAEFQGIVPAEIAEKVASDITAAANFIEMDARGPQELQDSYSIMDMQVQQNKMLWAYRVDIPSQHAQFSQKLYQCYDKYLGEEFPAQKLAEFHRMMAKVLKHVK